MTTKKLSDYQACEAADTGHGVRFLMALTGEAKRFAGGPLSGPRTGDWSTPSTATFGSWMWQASRVSRNNGWP